MRAHPLFPVPRPLRGPETSQGLHLSWQDGGQSWMGGIGLLGTQVPRVLDTGGGVTVGRVQDRFQLRQTVLLPGDSPCQPPGGAPI